MPNCVNAQANGNSGATAWGQTHTSGCDNSHMPHSASTRRPTTLAIWLIIAGVVGWWAAFSLTMEKFHLLENPGSKAACDFSVLVQCGENLNSPQGSVFGFPNPIIGLGAWIAPIVVGVALLAGAKFANWFWWLFELGMLFAIGFVIWLIGQSIFVIHTLCPWCMVTWSVVIPTFYAVTLYILRSGLLPATTSIRRAARALTPWIVLMTILSYALIALLAQLELGVFF